MNQTSTVRKSNHGHLGRSGLWTMCCCLLIAVSGIFPAFGQGTNVIQKWAQYPDASTNGMDVLATDTNMLADDFLCTTSGPVTHITIWGSWYSNMVASPCFSLGIWSDVPATNGFSHPGTLLWSSTFPVYQASLYAGNVFESFFDPSHGVVIGTDNEIWQYDFDFPRTNAFYQVSGNVYWLSVTASCAESVNCTTNSTCCTNLVYIWTNTVYSVSNIVYFQTNTICCNSNSTVSWGTNTFGFTTNILHWGTNIVVSGGTTVSCVTNAALFGWKTCVPADNWNDNGVLGHTSSWPIAWQDWQPLIRPGGAGVDTNLNLSFMLYTTQ